MHTFHSWLQGTETLISCSFPKWKLFFPCITGYLEVSSLGPVPLIDGVYGQGPRCWHSLCYVLVVFMLVMCGHKVGAPSLSSPEEARDGGGLGERPVWFSSLLPLLIESSAASSGLPTPSPMAQSYLIFLIFFHLILPFRHRSFFCIWCEVGIQIYFRERSPFSQHQFIGYLSFLTDLWFFLLTKLIYTHTCAFFLLPLYFLELVIFVS